MKILNKVVIGMATLVLLTACGAKKVDYDKFHAAAVEAAKNDSGYTKAVVDGKATIKKEGKETTYTFDKIEITGYTNGRMDLVTLGLKVLSAKTEAEAVAIGFTSMPAEEVVKSDKFTYYTGPLTVKMVDDEGTETVQYDKNGLTTSIKFSGDASGSVKIQWSK